MLSACCWASAHILYGYVVILVEDWKTKNNNWMLAFGCDIPEVECVPCDVCDEEDPGRQECHGLICAEWH